MSPVGSMLIALCILTAGLGIASIWLLSSTDKKTCIMSTAAIACVCAFVISFIDVSPPVIKQREKTFSYTSNPGPFDIVTAYDNSDRSPRISFISITPSSGKYDRKNKKFTFSAIGMYMLTFSAEDKNKNRKEKTLPVHIIDDIPPVFNLLHESVKLKATVGSAADVAGSADQFPGAQQNGTAQNRAQPNTGQQNGAQPGTTRQNTIKPLYAQQTAASQNLEQQTPAAQEPIQPSEQYPPSYFITEGATAHDEIDGDVTDTIVMDDSLVDYSSPGTYFATLTAKDKSDNVATTSVRVVIVENIPQENIE